MLEKEYKTTNRRTILIDISAKACAQFGFVHKQRVNTKYGYAIVIGVAPSLIGSDDLVLWLRFEKDGEKVSYCDLSNIIG